MSSSYQLGSPWPHNGGVSNTNSSLSPFQGPFSLTAPLIYSDSDNLAFLSTPIVDASGVIYVIRGGSQYNVGNYSYLYALNPDFSVNWVSNNNVYMHGAPALSNDGILYVGSSSGGFYAGILLAYDTQGTTTNGTMDPVWSSVPIQGYPANGPPAIGPDGTIYYVGSAQNDPNHSFLYAFDPCSNPTGDVLYKWLAPLATNTTTQFANSSSPAFDSNGILYVGAGQYLYAFTSHDSTDQPIQPLWKSIPIGDNIYTSPLVDASDQIFIATDTGLCAFNNQGQPLWSQPYGTNVSPALTPDGYIVLATDTCLNIVNRTNGVIEDSLGIGFSTNPCVDACGNIYVGSPTDNSVYKIKWDGNTHTLSYDSSYSLGAGNLFVREVYSDVYSGGFNNAGFSLGANGTLYVSPMDEYGINTHFYGFTSLLPPQITNVTRGDGTAIITFIPPVNTGVSPISYYLLETNGVLDTQTQYPGTNDQITVTGLTNTTSYTFFLYAVNQNGATSGQSNPGNLNVPCFKEDTKILTDKGYLPIQSLRKGDLVKTSRHGFVPIDTIGLRNLYHYKTPNRNPNVLYKCSQEKYPELFEDLIITGYHAILVDEFQPGEREKTLELLGDIYVTEGKYRLPACIDERTTIYEKEGDYKIYHIALENPSQYKNYGIYANGLLVETCSKRYLKEYAKMTLL